MFDEAVVRAVYEGYIAGWNASDAEAATRGFTDTALLVGFDGTTQHGLAEIRDHLAAVFANHQVARYVPLVREIREMAGGVALLRAEAGMVPPGGSAINPAANSVHTLVAVETGDTWSMDLFQATPAAWHGRESDVEALTAELQGFVDSQQQ